MARRSEVRCLLFLCIRNEVRHEALSFRLGHIAEERDYLASSRPTAVNLFWALDRMYARAASLADESPREITAGMRAEAVAALVALGYDGASAGRAVASVPDCDRVEDMIMQALRATTK